MPKFAVFVLALLPLLYSLWQVYLLQAGASHQLGADPAKVLVTLQGEWAIRLLILTLLVSPLRKLTGWRWLQPVRRMLGLFTFFYASLHLLSYTVFMLELDFSALWGDLQDRPYIIAGFTAWLLLLPMAITSTDAMMRLLRQRWRKLHMTIYGVALLAVLHVFWQVRSDYFEAVVYGSIIVLLLFFRVFDPRKIRPGGWTKARV